MTIDATGNIHAAGTGQFVGHVRPAVGALDLDGDHTDVAAMLDRLRQAGVLGRSPSLVQPSSIAALPVGVSLEDFRDAQIDGRQALVSSHRVVEWTRSGPLDDLPGVYGVLSRNRRLPDWTVEQTWLIVASDRGPVAYDLDQRVSWALAVQEDPYEGAVTGDEALSFTEALAGSLQESEREDGWSPDIGQVESAMAGFFELVDSGVPVNEARRRAFEELYRDQFDEPD